MLRGFKLLLTLLPVGVVVGGITVIMLWLEHPERFPLRVIELRNELQKIEAEEVQQAIASYLSQGFFGLDMEAIQKKLFDLPWTAKVSVHRIWPDKLAVYIKERTPQALWEEKAVLSTDALIFYPKEQSLPTGLPRFRGPLQRVKEIQQQYFVLLEMLGPLGLAITELDLSADGSWQIRLDNGIAIILGKTAINERMARFVLAYGSIQAKMKEIAYLDLRYTNGMAIGWKTAKLNAEM